MGTELLSKNGTASGSGALINAPTLRKYLDHLDFDIVSGDRSRRPDLFAPRGGSGCAVTI